MNSTARTPKDTKEAIELQVRTDLIKAQIKIARMNNLEKATIAFPNSKRIKDKDIEKVLTNILCCSEPEIFSKQTISTVGSCTVSLWTLKI